MPLSSSALISAHPFQSKPWLRGLWKCFFGKFWAIILKVKNRCRYFKVTEANRRRGPGTREKVTLRRINLEGNTHVQESNASQLPV
jgi:hypothetical protein